MTDDRRIVMRCTVEWVTRDPNDLVEQAFRHYDEQSDLPSPIDFVEAAIRWASTQIDWTAPTSRPGSGFELRVSGPEAWSAAFGRREG